MKLLRIICITVGAIVLVALSLSALNITPFLIGQGSLDPPPGPPAPTMKTLDQVEPRIPIDATHTPGDASNEFIISQPGSYYLTGNVFTNKSVAIVISTAGVTVDLNGFQIARGSGSGGKGIYIVAGQITIKNGSITGFGMGIDTDLTAKGVIITQVSASNCGTGMQVFYGTISSCVVSQNGFAGIEAYACTIVDCAAQGSSTWGFDVDYSTLIHCTAYSNANGIHEFQSIVQDCTVTNNTIDGIHVAGGRVVGNNCIDNGAGVHAVSGDNLIEGNNVTGNGRGIDVDAGGNLIIRNTARSNTTNYDIVAGNMTGTIVTTEAAMNSATNSNINISY